MGEWAKSMFDEIFGGGLFSNIYKYLTINPATEYADVWKMIEVIYDKFATPLALGIMVIWFSVSFIQKAANENVTFESLFLAFTKLIVAKFLIENGVVIFSNLWSWGIKSIEVIGKVVAFAADPTLSATEIEASLAGSLGTGSIITDETTLTSLWKELTGCKKLSDTPGFSDSFRPVFSLFLPWVATKVMIIVIAFVCYSRLIEMFVRMMVAPIALSDFMTEGTHGTGWKYLKSFFAIALQGPLIYIIALVFSKLMLATITNAGDFWTIMISYLVFGFSACALILKSLTLSKELLGVN